MNFGPLNKEGGWRRLNVAITRARREILVFSTLTHDQVDLNKSQSAGVRDLKRFLQFAEQGEEAFRRELAVDLTAEFDSPFESEVSRVLEERGWIVHRQVGCSGYRIDLAIVDPKHPGRYLLGIECDGASYHSAPSARDRDKLRQDVLEDLGWRLHRIWSTDWWEDRERELAELLEALDDALARRAEPPTVEAREQGYGIGNGSSRAENFGAVTGARQACASQAHPQGSAAHGWASNKASPGPEAKSSSRITTGLRPATSPSTPAERVEKVLDAIRSDPKGHPYLRNLAPYRAVPLALRGAQDNFYSDTEAPRIADALSIVVQTEAPILESVAVRRVGELWGFMRMKSKAVARVTRCIEMAHVYITQEGNDRVLWPDVDDTCSFRVARLPIGDDERDQRAVAEVPLVELAELLRFWIDEAGPMSERELLEHTNRSLGFKGLGSTIRDRLQAGLRVAIDRGVLVMSGDAVRRRSG